MFNTNRVFWSVQALYGAVNALYWKCLKRQNSTHLTPLKHQNTKTSLYKISKNQWVIMLLEIFGSVRRKLQSTVSLDHPVDEREKPGQSEFAVIGQDLFITSANDKRKSTSLDANTLGKFTKDMVVQDQSGTNQQALDEKVKSMMERGQKKIPSGQNQNGTPKHAISWICKVCGMEDKFSNVTRHVESNHLEGVSIPCDFCDKICPSRNSLSKHKSRFHK